MFLITKGKIKMCVIIHKEKHIRIDNETIENAWRANSHGAGIIAFKGKKPTVFKTMKLKALKAFIENHQKHELLIHFRLATHGVTSKYNNHPFDIGGNRWFMHNGMLDHYGMTKSKDSDSRELSYTLKQLSTDKVHDLLECISYSGQRFATFDNGEVTLIGDYHDYNGLTCSNLHFIGMPRYPQISWTNNSSPIVPTDKDTEADLSVLNKLTQHGYYECDLEYLDEDELQLLNLTENEVQSYLNRNCF